MYSNSLRQRRTLLLNPKRFLKFKELKPDKSYNLYRHIMKKYILNQNNIVAHHWEDFDLYPYVLKNYSSKNNRYYKQLCVDIVPEDHGPLMNEGVYIYCRSCYDN